MSVQASQIAEPTNRKCIKSDIDGSWAWMILLATIVNSVIATGQITSVNIYYMVFLEEFQASSSFTAWIPAAQTSALCLAGPLTSALLKRLGSRRTMFLGATLMALCFILARFANSIPYLILNFAFLGVAHNFIDGGNLSALSMYFHKKLSFATGIMYAGSGIGFMIIGLEIEWAVEMYGWRGAMLVQSGLAFQMCVGAALVFAMPRTSKTAAVTVQTANGLDECRKEETQPDSAKLSIKTLRVSPQFWLSVVELLAIQGNFSTMATVLKGWVIASGHQSSFKIIITMIGVGGTLGRILTGPLSNRLGPPIYLIVVATLLSTTNILFVLRDIDFWTIAALSFAFGFFQGQLLVCWVLKIAWAFGHKEFAIVRGYVFFFGAFASLAFPPMIGYTVDLTGRYDISLIISSASSFFCVICGILSFVVHHRSIRSSRVTSESNGTGQKGLADALALEERNSDTNKVKMDTSVTCSPG